MEKNKETRTDVLIGELAEVFAFMNCDVYNSEPSILNGNKFGVVKAKDGDKYYVAKSVARWNLFANDPTYSIGAIRTEPVELAKNGDNFMVKQCNQGLDIDIIIDGKVKTLFYNKELYPFASAEARQSFEEFALDAFNTKAKFSTLSEISDYFADENFVVMAKNRIKNDIEIVCPDNVFAKKFLIRKATKEIEKYEKQGTMGE